MATISKVAVAASTTKVAEPVVTVVSAPKAKTVVAVAPTTATAVTTAPAAPAVTTPAKTTATAPGGDTAQPAQTAPKPKVYTTSPVTAQPTYNGINN